MDATHRLESAPAAAVAAVTNLVDLLRARALATPDRRAYAFLADGETESEALSWGELDARARAIGAALAEQGARGERVLLLFPPGLDFVAAFFGCLYAGAVAVPSYPPRPHRDQPRLRAIARDARPAFALTTAEIAARREVLAGRVPELAGTAWLAVEEVEPWRAELWSAPEIAAGMPAFLQYTSGSTALPKGVMVTHANILHNEEMIRAAFGQSEDSVVVGWLPLYHDMGLIGNVLQPLYAGASCVLMPPLAFLQKPVRWLRAIHRYRGTTGGGPNFAYELCVRKVTPEERAELDLSSWTLAFNGAEPVRAETLDRFAEAFASCGFRREVFYPCYGLAEATLFVAGGRHGEKPVVERFAPAELERGKAEVLGEGRQLVGCGGAWAGQRVVVVDPAVGEIVEPGRIGEVWVMGPSVAAGYWDRPEETAHTFGAWLADGSGPFLRTGDLGFARNGDLFVTGRLKDLIILRGRNHYPQDLELTAERAHPDLEPGGAAAFSVDVAGEERLLLVLEVGRRALRGLAVPAVAAAVRQAIAEEHEVQVHEVVLIRPGTLPRTSSGKVQRHACRAAWLAGGEGLEIAGRDAVELSVAVEETLECPNGEGLRALAPEERRAAVVEWLRGELARAAGVDPASLGEDAAPASAGLDSLAAVEINHRLETRLGVALPLTRWLEARSLGELAEEIAVALDAPFEEAEEVVAPTGEAVLSVGQQGLWLLEQLAPGSGMYNVPVPLRILGDLDVTALRRCLDILVERHASLRGVELLEEDASAVDEARLAERHVEEAFRPFDLEAGPLLRAAIFRLAPGESILLLTVHHSAVDFWSLAVLVRELSALYRQETGGETAVLPAPVRTYADHVAREERRLAGPEGETLWAYWRGVLGCGLQDLELATDRPRPPVQTYRGLSVPFSLGAELSGTVAGLARIQGATLFATLLAGFEALLHRYTGQDGFAVGVPAAGRDSADFADVVGYFVNLLPLRADFADRPAFAGLIERASAAVTGGLAHQAFPFPRLAERLRPERDPSRPPVFQVSFVLQKAHRADERAWSAFALGEEGARAELGGLPVESVRLAERRVPFEVVLMIAETEDGLAGSLQMNADLFDAATAERMASHFSILLAEMVAEPGRAVTELPLLSESELQQIRHGWGETAPAAEPFLVHREVARRAEERPDAPAVVAGDLRLTYAELHRRASGLAQFLRRRGIGPERVVGLYAERSPELLVGALGVLEAGAAYLPLDPAQPVERLRRMLTNSGARMLLTRQDLAGNLVVPGIETALLDRFEVPDGRPVSESPVDPANLAYLIYTSGSTGVPKGAEMGHAGLANLVAWHRATYGVTPEDRATLVAGVGFDASVWEMWPYLTAGASIWIPSAETVASPPDLLAWIAEQEITLAFLPTPLAEAVLALPLPKDLALRALLTGGDRLLTRPPAEARFELINHYGPTEGTVVATAGRVGRVDGAGERVPSIGRPIAGVRVAILDRELRPVPAGVPGEILLGGAGLARGYLGHPRMTAEAFVPDPLGAVPGARVYRTGDLARWLPDGRIEFLGRRDHQVKIRGIRLELGEVEAALRACPGVREAVALVRVQPGGKALVAYLAAEADGAPEVEELRSRLRERLPEAMVPAAFVVLEALPLTPNGKVDRAALAKIAPATEEETAKSRLPRTPVEERLAAIWAEVLGVTGIGAGDDFFSLGGHSLLASQVASRVRTAFSVELPLAVFFESPRLADLAAAIDAARDAAFEDAPLVPVPRYGEIPLSFSQERLWFLDRLEPGSAVYDIPAAIRLRGALDADGLEAALAGLVERHEALRTTFPAVDGRPFQRIHPPGGFSLERVDLEGAEDPEAEALELARAEAARPFDLEAGPLFRAALLRLGAEDHVLLLNLHHTVADGWSLDVLARDLSNLAVGAPLAPLPVQYADFAVWQRKRLSGSVMDRLLEAWRERLAGAPVALELPTDRPRPAAQSYRGAVETVAFPAVRAEGATLFMTVLAGLSALLHRITGQDDVVIGSPVAGRDRQELEGLIGFFVNTLPLRVDLAGDPDFAALVRRARQATVGAHALAEVPFEKLVEVLRPTRDLSRSPLFQVLLTVQDGPAEPLRLPGVTAEPIPASAMHGGTSKFDLTVALMSADEGIVGGIEYATDLFDAATIRRFAGHLGILLEAASTDPSRRLGDLPLLTAAEERQLLVDWNATAAPYPSDRSLHELFEEQAQRTPDAVAVVWGTERVTYAELQRRAWNVAAWLLEQGLEPEERVAVSMPRTPDLIAALLGVLAAGGAYVPVDPAYPRERIEFLVADSGARIVLREPSPPAPLPRAGEGSKAKAEAADSVLAFHPSPARGRGAGGEGLAYLIYTSGSTGKPKGVGVRHSSAVARVIWAAGAYAPEVWRGVLAATSINFDLSVFEIFVPLSLGGTVILADDALALRGLPAADEVTLINTVPSAMAELVRLGAVPESVRVVNLAGEALRRELADAVLGLPRVEELWNLYGPSEDTTYSTGARIERGAAEAPSIGQPLPNSRAFVIDPYGRLAPVGVPGELWLGGSGLSRGYLGRPELTADRFRPDPFGGEVGGRLYRTGDLVRWRPDGLLDYLGRLDQQVKVRGFRIELGEIEAALTAHPAVAEAVVVAPEDVDGVRRLVAWVVLEEETETAVLRDFLAARLPSHMVPSVLLAIDEMPRTPNGKVDRRALIAREIRPVTAGEGEAPQGPAEIGLAAIWGELLGAGPLGRNASFFELGGHSLQAARLTARIRDSFGIEMPVRAVFERPTLAALAALITERAAEEGRVVEAPATVRRDGRDLPLSFAQERLWFLDQLESGTAFYNIPTAVRLRGPLRPELFREALQEIVRRHEAMRTTFGDIQGRPVQIIAPDLRAELPLVDLSALTSATAEAELRLQASEEISLPFDLAVGPLFRALLVRMPGQGDNHAAVLTLHHIIADGWSLGVLIRELSALYGAFAAGRPSPLPPLPIQYADFAVWQRKHLQGPAFEADVAWWRERLAGVPGLTLPTDRPRPAVEAFEGKQRSTFLPSDLSRDLAALARGERATLYMVLLTAFQGLLARSTGQTDIPVGSPVANRGRSETEGLIGFFANTLVLRTDVSERPSFRELLARVREVTLSASAHDEIPFEKLVEEIQPERDMSRNPLFQVMLVLQNQPWPAFRIGDVTLEPFDVNSGTAKFDLTIFWREQEGRIVGLVEHNTDLYDDSTILRFVRHYEALLRAAVADPDRPVAALPILDEAERHQILVEWKGPETDAGSAGLCIHCLVEEQVARTPDAIAVLHGDRSLTYAELNARANRLAHGLRGLGVGPESLVGICVERGVEMVVAMLGVLKAGGAGVALDPAYPQERLAFIIREAGLRALITQTALAEHFPQGPGDEAVRLLFDPGVDLFPDESSENPDSGVALDNPIYGIYTSGSTGQPKGILVTHRAFSNLLDWQLADPALVPGARTVQLSTFGFCVSFQEMFSSWGSGGSLVLADEMTRRDIPGLTRFLEETGVERLHMPFAALKNLAEAATGQDVLPARLKEVITAGEQLQVTPAVRQMFERLPGCTLSNQYGASETHVISALTLMGDPDTWMAIPPVGRPISNVSIHLLDGDLEPVPVGVAGELYAGGACVARCYLDDPVLTAQKMVPDPFSRVPGSRLYRTGDAARYLADGRIEYHGRLDTQVKIRGFRVELGEIDTVLARHPAVRDVAVVARSVGGNEKRLVAYVVPALPENAAVEFEELRGYLKQTLPEYMVPTAFVQMERLPVNANGKLDQAALPEPGARAEAAYVPPRTAAEEMIAGIWAEVLGRDRVSAAADFFELGGHSLLATQVISRVRSAFGVELPLRALFEAPRVSELAARVEALRGATEAAPPLRPAARREAPPLSYAQERLWFLDQLEPGSPAYDMPGAVEIEGALDPIALAVALEGVVKRHEALRTTFEMEADEPQQRIASDIETRLPLTDLSALPEEVRQTEAERIAREHASVRFDLTRGPLLAAALVRLEAERWLFLVTMHHIVSDGWSIGILVREIAELYAAAVEERPAALAALPVQYADFAVWQRQWLAGGVLERQLAWWRERLAGAAAALELPADRPRPAVSTHRGATAPVVLASELVRDLQALARREGSTLFMTLLGGFLALLQRTTGQDDLVVGTAIAGRNRLETEGLIGLFVNSLALRADLSGDPDVRGLLARAREATLGASAHQDLPFERLVEELQPERSLAHEPIFQVMLILQNTPAVTLSAADLRLRPLVVESGAAKLDLSLSFEPQGEGLAGTLEYARDLFDEATVLRLAGHLGVLLAGVVAGGGADPARRLSELPLLTAGEQAQLAAWNETATNFALDRPFYEVFAERAAAMPDAVAAVCGAQSLTYSELRERSERLARRLMVEGIGLETVMPVFAVRGLDFLTAVLAVFAAGGAYLPLDPAHPRERQARILTGSEARLALVQRDLTESLQEALGTRGPRLLVLEDLLAGEAPEVALPAVDMTQLAYVIYTSGSTGTPKGAMVMHRGMLNHLWSNAALRGLGADDRMAQTASQSFDISVWQLLTVLLVGGQVHIYPDDVVRDPALLLAALEDDRITAMELVPSQLRLVVEEAEAGSRPALTALRWMVTIGEGLPTDVAAAWLRLYPQTPVVNAYGPTECSDSVAHEVLTDPPALVRPYVPIGRPIPNLRLHVVDAGLHPLPLGVPGEICIAGTGVGRGYLGDGSRTADAFRPDPFGVAGSRLYRTGDLGRLLPDGTIEFLGRIDHQVKIRGNRIELGEIEATLTRHPAVRQAVVLAVTDKREARLVAFVTPVGEAPRPEELRGFLAGALPEPMVPSAFVVLPELPLNANGKVDRRALRGLVPGAARTRESTYAPPCTAIERTLAEIWSAVLRVERVGLHDNFFALGGHSLAATRVVSRARRELGIELPVRTLFEHPVLGDLASFVGGARRERPATALLAPRSEGRDLPLSFAQQRLWFLDQLEPGNPAYNIYAAFRLSGSLDREALAASLSAIVERHEVLRTTFEMTEDGEPAQRIAPAASVPLPVLDLSGTRDPEAEVRRLARQDARRPFDLEHGPLLRATLLRLAPEEHALLFAVHHIVSDGWSLRLLVREIAALYPELAAGRPSPLAALPIQYGDFALWQRDWLRGEALEAQLAWWRERLAGAPAALDLPADHERPPQPSGHGATRSLLLAPALAESLATLGRREGASLFMVLLAGFASVVSRLAGQEDLVIGTEVAHRNREETEELIGFFVNQLALRIDAADDPPFLELLARVRETALGAYAHQDLPFERLVEELRPERDLSRQPVFQVSFTLQNLPEAELELPGLRLRQLQAHAETARIDLALEAIERPEGLLLRAEYSTDLFEPTTVDRLLRLNEELLAAAVAFPEARISALVGVEPAARPRSVAPAPAPVWQESAYVPPRDAIERTLAEIWSAILEIDRVGIHDNFFALGGHSLLATRAVLRMRRELGIDLPLAALFARPTVAALAEQVRAATGAPAAPPALRTVSRDGDLTPSAAQQRLWFIDQLQPGSPLYDITASWRLTGPLHAPALTAAVHEIVRRHETLRTVFPVVQGKPALKILPPEHPVARIEVPVADLTALPAEIRETEGLRLARLHTRHVFDLQAGPLLMLALVRLTPEAHLLTFNVHHIVADGWSLAVFQDELVALYTAALQGTPSPLEELPVQFADYAVWHEERIAAGAFDSQLAVWRQRLTGAREDLELPFDRPRPRVLSGRGDVFSFVLPAEVTGALEAQARRSGVSLFNLLLAGLEALFSRYSGQEDLSIGTAVAGRSLLETEAMIGLFVNTLVLRADLSGDPAFSELVGRAREVIIESQENQDLPFDRLVDELKPERSLSLSPFFQVMFLFQNVPAPQRSLSGLEMRSLDVHSGTAKFDLVLSLLPQGNALTGSLEYSTDLFDAATVERMAGHFSVLLAGAAADPSLPLSALPLLTPRERIQLLEEWNGTQTVHPAGLPGRGAHGLFEEQVARTPDAVAVVFGDDALTYAELERRANQLAHRLRRAGVDLEVPVGVYTERSIELIVAILAVFKSGGYYVPLDPSYPADRLGWIVEDSAVPVLLGQRGLLDRLPPHDARIVFLEAEEWMGEPETPPAVEVFPASPAYMTYTSGSTGRPKGVMNIHGGLVNRMRWTQHSFPLMPADTYLQKTPVGFDMSLAEILIPLVAGARLAVLEPGGHRESDSLARAIERYGVTVFYGVPSQLSVLLEFEELGERGRSLRQAMVGGEAMTGELAQRFYARLSARLWNLYGPTEAAIEMTWHPVELHETRGIIPIGRPVDNVRIHLLDRTGQLVPAGVPGELFIGGAQLCRGYWKRPDLTAERFVPDPLGEFFGTSGDRLYRTGDLARRRQDGEVEFLGRIDHQVKVRGVRIELGEIESVLLTHPGVHEAVVVARRDRADGGPERVEDIRLVACVVPEADVPGAGELRAWLRERVPEAMVPAAFLFLEAMPLSPNGKVDRAALAKIDLAEAELPTEVQGPRTPAEEMVAAVWREVLGLARVGIHDNFFDSGGHSLLATQVVSRLRESFGVEVPLRTLFEAPTVAGLAQALDELSRESEGIAAPPVGRSERSTAVPLSYAQEWMWLIDQLDATHSAFGVPLIVRLCGALDVGALGQALQEVVRRHEALRTTFPVVDGHPVQRIAAELAVPLPLVDLAGQADGEAVAERWIQEELRTPLDLVRGPLLRALLLRQSGEDHTLVLHLHHILFDGWSGGLLVRELAALYRAFTAGNESPLAELPIQYADFAIWQRDWLQGEPLASLVSWWKERLAGPMPVLELPGARRGPVTTLRSARLPVALGADLSAAVQGLARREGVTLFVALLAAWQTLLHRTTRETDIRVGAPVAGRNRPELEELIGYFVNTLVMRIDLGGDPAFRDLVGRSRETALGAWAHQDLPFTRLVEELQPDRAAGRTPLFQVMLLLQNTPVPTIELPGLSLIPVDREVSLATFDLSLVLAEGEEGLSGWLWYNRDLLEPAAVAHLIERFRVLLNGAVADPDRRLSELPLLTEAERRQLLEGRIEMPVESTVASARLDQIDLGDLLHILFEARVDAEPDAVALVWQGEETTYDDLDRAANRLARHLRALGVGPEVRVGLCLERSPRLVEAVLAVLKAGGAYLPLDPAYPAERLAFLLADSGAQVIVTEGAAAGHLPKTEIPVLRLDAPVLAAGSDERLNPAGVPSNLAYVIYTSGSTGRPKGVQVTHANVVRLFESTDDWFRFDERDTWTLFHSYAFDFSVWEIWGALLHGGKLVIVPRDVARSPEDFHELLRREKVTVLNQTPSAFAALQQVEQAQEMPDLSAKRRDLPLRALRWVIFGGEALNPAMLKPWVDRYGDPARQKPRLVNMYGITETTVHVTFRPIAAADLEAGSVIGEPIPDLRLYVLDERLEPTPPGVPGEMYVGGAGLSRGYLGRPDLTAERFVPDPFAEEPGARLYRTGDLARRLPDGDLEYAGRADDQVKIRGFRIEPGEIEAALARHPGVAEAVVTAREDQPGDKRLVGYLVPDARTAAPVRNLLRLDREGRLGGHGTFELPNGLVVAHQHEGVTLGIYREIFEGEVYRRHGLDLPPGACVFDVGANMGLFTLWVGRTVPGARIFSFEPIPATAEVLRLNAELHGLNATVYAAGIADAERTEVFTYYPFFSSTSGRFPDLDKDRADIKAHILNEQRVLDAQISDQGASAFETWRRERETALDQWLDDHMKSEKVACRLTTISSVIREHGLERIDLLKLDAERSELDALAGIAEEDWPKIRQMVIEVHDAGIRDQVLEVLAVRGYEAVVEQDVYLEGTELYNVYARRSEGRREVAGAVGPEQATGSDEGAHTKERRRDPQPRQPEAATTAWASPTRLIDDVRAFATEHLPEHMVPAAWVVLDALPLTAHGKVDRRALPAPREAAKGVERPIVEPRTPVESELVAIWRELLGVDRISIYDNFFELGGHSLLLTQLASRIRSAFQVELPLRVLFDVANVVEMTEAIAAQQAQQVDQTEMAAMLDELKGLSPEEIRALLEAEG